MSFVSFIRRLEGKESLEVCRSFEGVPGVSLGSLKEVLRGDYSKLWRAFSWSSTEQGYEYWADKDSGLVPLTPEDFKWLKGLLKHHETET